MKKKSAFLAALMLCASLASCAPSISAPSGPQRPDEQRIKFTADGWSQLAAVDLLEVRPDTAANQLVRLPDCNFPAYWGDIQRVGVPEARAQCLLGLLIALLIG